MRGGKEEVRQVIQSFLLPGVGTPGYTGRGVGGWHGHRPTLAILRLQHWSGPPGSHKTQQDRRGQLCCTWKAVAEFYGERGTLGRMRDLGGLCLGTHSLTSSCSLHPHLAYKRRQLFHLEPLKALCFVHYFCLTPLLTL